MLYGAGAEEGCAECCNQRRLGLGSIVRREKINRHCAGHKGRKRTCTEPRVEV